MLQFAATLTDLLKNNDFKWSLAVIVKTNQRN